MRLAVPVLAALLLGLLAVPAMAGPIESLMTRARAAEAAGHLDTAALLMQSAIVANPARAASYVALGDLYARHGDPHFAHKYYDDALYLEPALPAALAGAGQADLALGDRAAATEKLGRLEAVCGKDCAAAARLRAALGGHIAAEKPGQEDAAATSLDKH